MDKWILIKVKNDTFDDDLDDVRPNFEEMKKLEGCKEIVKLNDFDINPDQYSGEVLSGEKSKAPKKITLFACKR